jgi:peptide-methionine (R)-S-oxide reductase
MRMLITTLLSLPLLLLGLQQVQGMEKEKMHEDTSMSQSMSSDGMMKSDDMKSDDMKSDDMKSDDMKSDDMKSDNMKSDDMKSDDMKSDDMKEHDTMKNDQSMAPKHEYQVPSDADLRQRLTPLQYKVTRKDGTEPAFSNAYWNNHEPGLYVDVISGVPLFSSLDKYQSGTGWPSFTRPLEPANIVEKEDRGFFSVRTEIRSKLADAHLGHVFDDGPPPTGLRYCMNSAALRFVPAAELEQQGYGAYAKLFK